MSTGEWVYVAKCQFLSPHRHYADALKLNCMTKDGGNKVSLGVADKLQVVPN